MACDDHGSRFRGRIIGKDGAGRFRYGFVPTLLAAGFGALSLAGLPAFTSGGNDPGLQEGGKPPAHYSAAPITILDLQPFRHTSSIQIKGVRGEPDRAALTNLNTNINSWYLLELRWPGVATSAIYHLESADARSQKILLDGSHPDGLVILRGNERTVCDLWGSDSRNSLDAARRSGAAYVPLCGGRLYLRNPTKGHRTSIEVVTDLLRDKVPGGESVVDIVRDTIFTDSYRETAKVLPGSDDTTAGGAQGTASDRPGPALLDPVQKERLVESTNLGIQVQSSGSGKLTLGNWYPARGIPGIYVSLVDAGAIAPEVLHSYTKVVAPLDSLEAGALVYLVAFDLAQFDLKFALGTEHPRLGWSEHMLDQMRDESMPGPDGIDNAAPLILNGLVNPRHAAQTVATFAGGFKRAHGAFMYGSLAYKNHGSHYGFIEDGVTFSRLQPDLSTIYVLDNGQVELLTWTEGDNRLLQHIRYARQNGVPIITGFDVSKQMSIPGPLVSRWGEGNWSGSVDRKLRTLRAGAALQQVGGKRYLIYALFTGATPSAMARVFQAYRCLYAMHLDMNALEHTYMAVYQRQGSSLNVEYLLKGMRVVDELSKGQYVPRFIGYADNRDFFYLLRKEGK
jgi:hypothetical protein